MPVDASIYGQIQQPQQINPLNALAQSLQIKGLQSQLDRGDRETAQQNKLAELYKSSVGQDGAINRQQLLTGAASSGLGMQIPALQKGFSEQDKASREAQKAELEGVIQKFDVGSRIMSAYDPANPQSWNAVRQQTAQLLGADAAARLPEQPPSPEQIQQNMNRAMSAKELAEQKYKMLTFGETQRHNNATEGLTAQGQAVTMRNADQSRDTTMRGQDMTDARAREFNATKVDENKLKREQKQETAEMTKAGQVASFDTMLGTLDRLGQHPGLTKSVGLRGKLPTIPGSDSANFQAELDTFQSQAFVPMVAQLKGMGALSDAEGRKLTQAVGALNPNMGEQAFRESIKRIQDDMESARKRVVGAKGEAAPAKAGAPDLSSLEAELKRRGLLK